MPGIQHGINKGLEGGVQLDSPRLKAFPYGKDTVSFDNGLPLCPHGDSLGKEAVGRSPVLCLFFHIHN